MQSILYKKICLFLKSGGFSAPDSGFFIFYGNHSATVQARNTDSELKGLYIRALRVISDLFPHPLFDSLQQTINHRFWHLQLRVVANIIQGK